MDQVAGLALTLSHEIKQRHLVIATTLPPSAAARESAQRLGVEIWDQSKLLELASSTVLNEYFGVTSSETEPDEPTLSKGNALLESLRSTSPGRSEWSAYQRLMGEILEFLFCPPLDAPRNEIPDQDARNRRDMIFENNADDGFWARLRSGYEAHYIVVDAKNYVSGLKKGPILDVAHYLKPHGCGMFALITSRKGAAGAAWHAVREQWIASRKLILVLDDRDIEEMISLKVEARDPEDLLRRRIAEFRMGM